MALKIVYTYFNCRLSTGTIKITTVETLVTETNPTGEFRIVKILDKSLFYRLKQNSIANF